MVKVSTLPSRPPDGPFLLFPPLFSRLSFAFAFLSLLSLFRASASALCCCRSFSTWRGAGGGVRACVRQKKKRGKSVCVCVRRRHCALGTLIEGNEGCEDGEGGEGAPALDRAPSWAWTRATPRRLRPVRPCLPPAVEYRNRRCAALAVLYVVRGLLGSQTLEKPKNQNCG